MSIRGAKAGRAQLMLLSEISQVVLGSAPLVILLFTLSEDDFGRYATILSVATAVGIATNLGAGTVLLRRSVRGGDLGQEWRQSLGTVLSTSIVGVVAMAIVTPILIPSVPRLPTLFFGIVQAVCYWIAELATPASVVAEEISIAIVSRALFGAGRLGGLFLFLIAGSDSLLLASMCSCLGAVVGTVLAVRSSARRLGCVATPSPSSAERMREGSQFMVSDAAGVVLTIADRPLLARAGLLREAGDYAIAYRLAQLMGLPTLALVRVTDGDFHELGVHGISATIRHARRNTAYACGMASLVAIGAFVGIEVIGDSAGDRAMTVLEILRWLALLPVIQSVQFFAGNCLSGSSYVSLRNRLYGVAIVINVTMNLVLIPTIGWKGSAISTLTAEGLLAAALWAAVYRVAYLQRHDSHADAGAR